MDIPLSANISLYLFLSLCNLPLFMLTGEITFWYRISWKITQSRLQKGALFDLQISFLRAPELPVWPNEGI